MKRKIVKHGSATLTVSLPSKWAKKYNLKKGDLVEVIEREGALLLNADSSTAPKRTELEIDTFDDIMLEWILSALHKKGFDEIKLIYNKPRTKTIYNIIQNLMTGFAIIDQTEKSCLLKAIAKDESMEFDATLKRVFMVVISFANSCLESIKKDEISKLEEFFFLENTVNKLVNFCERVLIKNGYKRFEKTPLLYLMVWNLEKISEYYYMMFQHLIKNKEKMSPGAIELLSKTNDSLKLFYDAFYKFDFDKLISLNKLQKSIVKEAQKPAKSNFESITLAYIREIATKINCSGLLTALNYE